MARLQTLGFASFGAFLDAHPGVPYVELAALLGADDVAAVQLEHLHTRSAGTGRTAAQADSLARFLRSALKRGWGVGKYWQSSLAGALASWSAMWGGGADVRAIERRLFALEPSEGWVPQSADDPTIVAACRLQQR